MSHPKPLTPTDVMAINVKELRKRHGWTAAQLAERMTKLGFRWDRFTVQNLENRRRTSVSLDETFALAYVLDAAPAHLIVPLDDTEQWFPVVPGVNVPVTMAAGWIRGQVCVGEQDPRLYFSQVPVTEWRSRGWEPPTDSAVARVEQEAPDNG